MSQVRTKLCEFREEDKKCDFEGCVTDVKSIFEASASRSDKWILTFEPTISFVPASSRTHGYFRPKHGFFKYFLSPDSIRLLFPDDPGLHRLEALRYEALMYWHLIRPILDLRISPHFVRPFYYSSDCTFDNLLEIYPHKEQLKRNVLLMLTNASRFPRI